MDTSLADIAAVTRDNDGWGNNSGLWLFAILALMGGGFGNWGNRNGGDFGQYATAASQTEILLGQQFQGLDNKIDRIGNGIADATYALNNTINGVQTTLGGAINTEGRAIQSQLAECCCTTQRNTDALRFDMANYASATQQAIHAEGEQTRNLLQQNKIEALQGQINQLQLQAAMSGVVRYPMASTYTSGANPFCACGCGNI